MNKKDKKVKGWGLFCMIIIYFMPSVKAESIFLKPPRANSTQIEMLGPQGNLLCFQLLSSNQLRDDGFGWLGKNTQGSGFLTLAYVGGKLRGSVISPSLNIQLKGSMSNQTFFSSESKIRECGGCKVMDRPVRDPRSGAQSKHAWRNSDAGQIDLMVVYPTDVINAIGSLEDTLAEIENAVTGANLCFRNSQVQIQLRLVHTLQTSYNPTGNLDLDLDRLTKLNDGYLDDIHAKRDEFGADIVTLLSPDSSMGGLANTLSFPNISFEDSAFNVCVWDQIGAPVFTLAHEIGHNMGCLHNREDASDSSKSSSYDYGAFAYGKRWFLNGKGYRTIMSYNDSDKNYENTAPFFSNPSVSYLGVVTGNEGQEDNAKALSISSPYVSNFRASKIQGILPSLYRVVVKEGNSSSLMVRLSCPPTEKVTVSLSLSNSTNFILGSSSTLTFDQSNWNLRQPVPILAVSDNDSLNSSGILNLTANGLSSVAVNLSATDTGTDKINTEHYFTGVAVNPFGVAVNDVKLSFSTGGHSLFTDQNGSFALTLENGYSGVVTPSKVGYSFSPSSVSIEKLASNSLGNVFVAARSSVVSVDPQANGLNNGSSWADAFTDLSEALELVDSFTEVWVAEGTYNPMPVRSGSFVIPGGVSVLGGFTGNEIKATDRNYSQNKTILSGDIGVKGDAKDNSFHVVVALDGSVLDGFMVEDGNATENYSDDRGLGSGLWAEGSSFEIRNCQFTNNWAFQGGSAAWLNKANGTFINCIFSSNETGSKGSGGAIWATDSNLTLESSTLSGNNAAFWGGAVRADSSLLQIKNSSFLTNKSSVSNGGGALYLKSGSFTITSSNFSSNQSNYEGGAILIEEANGTIADSNFTDNLNIGFNGGGALFIDRSSPTISKCSFIRNKTDANNYGGAIKLVSSSPLIENCDFQYNQSTVNSGGALFVNATSNPTLSINEFSYNSAAGWGGAVYNQGAEITVSGGLFLGNWARLGGGVATDGTLSTSFERIKIFGNESNTSSDSQGGFLYLGSGATHTIFTNCVIAGNKSANRHGVVATTGEVRFVNCTLYGNEAVGSGAISLLFTTESVLFENSILWANTDKNGYEIFVNSGTASVDYSIVKVEDSPGLNLGLGVISSEPTFVDFNGADNAIGTADDDFRLSSGSAAIGVASSSFSNYQNTDIIGRSRDSAPDIGAYEYFVNSAPVFSGSTALSIFENKTSVIDLNATDADGDALTFSIVNGSDKLDFGISTSSGVLRFLSSPDYEYPADSGGNNIYEVTVEVSDGFLTDQISLQITVKDVDESVGSPENAILLFNGYVLGNGWRQASWFGTYHAGFYPWVYHADFGWVYIVQSKNGETWMWKHVLGWCWTDVDVFPYFLINSSRQWAYAGSNLRAGQYYSYEAGQEGWLEFK